MLGSRLEKETKQIISMVLCSTGISSNDYIPKYLWRGEKQPPEPRLKFSV